MARLIWNAAKVSLIISFVIFAILKIAEWAMPQWFQGPVDLWLLGLLFAVAFVPRLLGIGMDRGMKPGGRRKT